MGGIVNAVTKSGTNDFQGGAFWFYRSTGCNARDRSPHSFPPRSATRPAVRLAVPSGFSCRVPWLPVDSCYLPACYRSDARLRKILTFDEAKRNQLYLNFEVFNLADTWSARGYTSSQAYTETKSILTPAPSDLYVTAARRKQISGRFVF